jgi:hypothetical protein
VLKTTNRTYRQVKDDTNTVKILFEESEAKSDTPGGDFKK